MSQQPSIPPLPQELFEPDYQLPLHYQETYLVLMIRDPHNIYAYWEIAPSTIEAFAQSYSQKTWEESQLAIRLNWDGFQKIIKVDQSTTNWYINLEENGVPFNGELGRLLSDNTFISLAISNYLITKVQSYSGYLASLKQQKHINWEPLGSSTLVIN